MNRNTLFVVLDHLPEITRREVAGIVLSQQTDAVASTVLFDVVVGHALPGWEMVVGAIARTGAPWSPPSQGNPEDVARTIALGILVPENTDRRSETDRRALDEVATTLLLLIMEDESVLAGTPASEVVTFAETLLDGIEGADAPFTRDALRMLTDQIEDGHAEETDETEAPAPAQRRRATGPRPRAAGFDALLGMIDQVGDIADIMQGIFKRIFPR